MTAQNESVKASNERLRVEVGQRLRQRRTTAGLSQRELADQAGFDYYTFISQIEAGRGKVPAERYEAYARAISVDPRDFAIRMLQAYENSTYKLLFPADALGEMERRLRVLEEAAARSL